MNVTAITKRETAASALEQVLIRGDLSKLSDADRNTYYLRLCESAGLNPLTQPFAYITLNGKLVLYALRNATDQLRTVHGISVTEITQAERDGVYVVTCKVSNANGRTDMATGAVAIANLKGEALANAMMKTETKAKRRATLSICGLGLLDETEVETIPDARAAPQPAPAPSHSAPATVALAAPAAPAKPAEGAVSVDPETGEIIPASRPRTLVLRVVTMKDGTEVRDWLGLGKAFLNGVQASLNKENVDEWRAANEPILEQMKAEAPKLFANIDRLTREHQGGLPPF